VAGFLNPDYFLGGALKIYREAAEQVVSRIANHFRISPDEAAFAILRIANDNAAQLLRLVSVQRGYDPRDFALVAYGGSGPMIAPFIAEELEIRKIVIPAIPPGNFSAWGLLMSDIKHTVVQTLVRRLDLQDTGSLLNSTYEALEKQIASLYAQEGITSRVQLERTADLRYYGQEHTLTVPVEKGLISEKEAHAIGLTFDQFHQREYGFRLESPVELVNLRVSGVAVVRKPGPAPARPTAPSTREVQGTERMVFWGEAGRARTVVYRRDLLPAGARFRGPAIIEEPTTTIVIPSSFTAVVHETGNLILERT
jgi:N-methylhydantoinase A